MSSPSCSVIIPVHNCRPYLPAALGSVDMQGMSDIEIIVVDDGSTDGADEWLSRRRKDDARLTVLTLDGRGPARARNAALQIAKSDLVAFLDADDFWWPGKLAAQTAYHQANPDVALTFTDYLHFAPSGALLGTCFDYWRPDFVPPHDAGFQRIAKPELRLLESNIVGTSTVVARRCVLQNADGFSQCTPSAEDWSLWLSIAARAPIAFSSAVTCSYLMRPNSATRDRGARIAAMDSIIAAYDTRADDETRRAARRARARLNVARAEFAREEGRFLNAARAHIAAYLARPERRIAKAILADFVNVARIARSAR